MKAHPNFYAFCGAIKKEMVTAKLDALAARTGNRNKKSALKKKDLEMKKRREAMNEKLENGLTDLLSFQQAMGGILKVGDPKTGDDDDDKFFERNSTYTGDEPIVVPNLEDIHIPMPQDPQVVSVEQTLSNSSSFEPSMIIEHQANVSKTRKKNKSSKFSRVSSCQWNS